MKIKCVRCGKVIGMINVNFSESGFINGQCDKCTKWFAKQKQDANLGALEQ